MVFTIEQWRLSFQSWLLPLGSKRKPGHDRNESIETKAMIESFIISIIIHHLESNTRLVEADPNEQHKRASAAAATAAAATGVGRTTSLYSILRGINGRRHHHQSTAADLAAYDGRSKSSKTTKMTTTISPRSIDRSISAHVFSFFGEQRAAHRRRQEASVVIETVNRFEFASNA